MNNYLPNNYNENYQSNNNQNFNFNLRNLGKDGKLSGFFEMLHNKNNM